MKQIKFYRNQSGKSPVEEFLDSLKPKQEIELAERRKADYLARNGGLK